MDIHDSYFSSWKKNDCLFGIVTAVTLSLCSSRREDVLTYSPYVAVLSCHHEWCFPCVIRSVHLCVVTQEELEALHVVREGCCMQGRSVGRGTRPWLLLKTSNIPVYFTSPKTSKCKIFFSPYETLSCRQEKVTLAASEINEIIFTVSILVQYKL